MTAATLNDLLGLPVNDEDLHTNVDIGLKATGASTAVAPGRVVFHTQATGVWAIATTGSVGRLGIVPKKNPLNTDSDPTLQVATKIDTRWYVEAAGAIKPGATCIPAPGGKVVAGAVPDATTTRIIYEGHKGEGDGLDAPTDAANGQPIRVRFG